MVALALIACSSNNRTSSTSTEPPPPFETPTPVVQHSGIPSVDAVIDAVASGNADALAALMRFPKIPCTTDHEGLGRPPDCPDGVANETPIEAMPVLACEGTYMVPGQEQQASQQFVDANPALYGVYQQAPKPDLPEAKYAVLYSVPGPPAHGVGSQLFLGWQLFVSDDGIVGISDGCGTPPEWIAQNSAGTQIPTR